MHMSRKVLVATLGCILGVAGLPLLTSQVSAAVSTSYVTANLAGADPAYGKFDSTTRRNNTIGVRYTVAVGNPYSVSTQEVCTNSAGQRDSLHELITAFVSTGPCSAWNYGPTGKVTGTCIQSNVVFAKGTYSDAGNWNLLPEQTEKRKLLCVKAVGFVVTMSCSTHLSLDEAYSAPQAQYARQLFDYLSTAAGAYGAWTGGDFNDRPNMTGPQYWYSVGRSECDRFATPPQYRPTQGTPPVQKYDYGFGFTGTVSQPGATLSGTGTYSDHAIVYCPYTWG